MRTLKALSALLTYPTAELCAAVPEIRATIAAEGVLGPAERAALEPLLESLATENLFDLQEAYVLLFDRTRILSLHLFEHVHGESRDRGQAMVDLQKVYLAAGLEIDASELPDYLPLFLEYASLLPADEARATLAEPAHVIAALAERAEGRKTPYAAVLCAVLAVAEAEPDAQAFAALAEVADVDPDDFEALDAVWEEEQVTFGPGAALADCGVDSLSAKIRQARRPAPGVEPLRGPRTIITRSSVHA